MPAPQAVVEAEPVDSRRPEVLKSSEWSSRQSGECVDVGRERYPCSSIAAGIGGGGSISSSCERFREMRRGMGDGSSVRLACGFGCFLELLDEVPEPLVRLERGVLRVIGGSRLLARRDVFVSRAGVSMAIAAGGESAQEECWAGILKECSCGGGGGEGWLQADTRTNFKAGGQEDSR